MIWLQYVRNDGNCNFEPKTQFHNILMSVEPGLDQCNKGIDQCIWWPYQLCKKNGSKISPSKLPFYGGWNSPLSSSKSGIWQCPDYHGRKFFILPYCQCNELWYKKIRAYLAGYPGSLQSWINFKTHKNSSHLLSVWCVTLHMNLHGSMFQLFNVLWEMVWWFIQKTLLTQCFLSQELKGSMDCENQHG